MNTEKLKYNHNYQVKSLTGDNSVCERLLEMGLTEDQIFKVLQKLPFGEPYIVLVNNLFVALREQELKCIQIHPQ